MFACKIIAANQSKKLATSDNLNLVYPLLKNARKLGVARVIKHGRIDTSAKLDLSKPPKPEMIMSKRRQQLLEQPVRLPNPLK